MGHFYTKNQYINPNLSENFIKKEVQRCILWSKRFSVEYQLKIDNKFGQLRFGIFGETQFIITNFYVFID